MPKKKKPPIKHTLAAIAFSAFMLISVFGFIAISAFSGQMSFSPAYSDVADESNQYPTYGNSMGSIQSESDRIRKRMQESHDEMRRRQDSLHQKARESMDRFNHMPDMPTLPSINHPSPPNFGGRSIFPGR